MWHLLEATGGSGLNVMHVEKDALTEFADVDTEIADLIMAGIPYFTIKLSL